MCFICLRNVFRRPMEHASSEEIIRENRIFRCEAMGDEKYSIFGDVVYQTLILYVIVAEAIITSKNDYFSPFSDPSVEDRNYLLNQKYLHVSGAEHRRGTSVGESFFDAL